MSDGGMSRRFWAVSIAITSILWLGFGAAIWNLVPDYGLLFKMVVSVAGGWGMARGFIWLIVQLLGDLAAISGGRGLA